MTVGTRSVLFGAHCFLVHPWFVALAWWRLYGLRTVTDPHVGPVSLRDPRLWLTFFLHDLGYWGKPNMDGPEGEAHPAWAARLLTRWTDQRRSSTHPDGGRYDCFTNAPLPNDEFVVVNNWGRFCLYHSRFLARRHWESFSLLCVADKLAVALEPWWLYLPRVVASGEIREYMALAGARNPESKYAGEPPTKYESMGLDLSSRRAWFENMATYLRDWAAEHADGRQDTWTPSPARAEVAA